MPGPIVKRGNRVDLRVLEREDIPFWQHGYADPRLRHPTGNPKVRTQQQVEALYEDESHVQFLICPDKEDSDGPIGMISVKEWGNTPTIGYWVLPAFQGEGYGKASVSLALEYIFNVYEAPTVKAKAFAHNDASRGLLETLGFQQEGRIRKDSFIDGAYRDGIVYGILREEWEESV